MCNCVCEIMTPAGHLKKTKTTKKLLWFGNKLRGGKNTNKHQSLKFNNKKIPSSAT